MLQFNYPIIYVCIHISMQLKDPLISVIIVNWNGGGMLQRCLETVFQQTLQDIEVILVDNASTDDSLELVEQRWPSVRIIHMEENKGFAVANNLAAQSAHGTWIALLNSDAFPEPHWLESLIDASQTHSGLFFFASCQIQADDSGKIDGTGDQYNIGGIAWRRQHNEPMNKAVSVMDEVFGACGASAFYPRDAFLGVGGFDESFFSYLEDVDLSFRLRLQGYRCMYVPDARVLHVGSASLGRESEFAIYHSLRNMVWVYFKNMPTPYFWIYLPVHMVMSFGYSSLYALCCCPWVSLRAMRDALLGLPSTLAARKVIQSTRNIDPAEVIRMMKKTSRRKRTLLEVIFLLPRLLIAFVKAVINCRKQHRDIMSASGNSHTLPLDG